MNEQKRDIYGSQMVKCCGHVKFMGPRTVWRGQGGNWKYDMEFRSLNLADGS